MLEARLALESLALYEEIATAADDDRARAAIRKLGLHYEASKRVSTADPRGTMPLRPEEEEKVRTWLEAMQAGGALRTKFERELMRDLSGMARTDTAARFFELLAAGQTAEGR